MKFFVTTCLAVLACSSCTGSIESSFGTPAASGQGGNNSGAGGGGAMESADPIIDADEVLDSKVCDAVNPGPAPMRRLTNAEYRNTVNDLLGLTAQVQTATANFSPETESLGFRNNADFLPVSSLAAEQFADAAEKLSAVVAADANFTKCANANKVTCGTDFIRSFGARAYRRPLTDEEITRYTATLTDAMNKYDYAAGVEWVVFAMLQSPNFLFRYETGKPVAGKSYARVDHYEMASRLSYLLWQSMPDAALFDAAKQGKLGTDAEVLAQAKRMLGDAKAERSLEFFRQWLDTDQLDRLSRDAAVFKNLPANLGSLFDKEVAAFTRDLMVGGKGTFAQLVSAPYTFVNADLAKLYGMSGSFGAEFVRAENPTASGVLTQAGFLAVHDKPTRTSIVLRGVKVRTDVMCELIPAPPNNVPLTLDKPGSGLSQKERLAEHRKDPSCASCHNMIDPVGEIFEGYDAVGRTRTTDESGKAVDTRGVISNSVDLDGPVANPLEFGKKLAASNAAQQCYLAQNFRFFYGRDYAASDVCSRAQLAKAWKDSGFNLKEMLLGLTQTDAFLYRPMTN